MDDDTLDMSNVWKIVDRELRRRKSSWAEMGRAIGASDQTMNNWSRRKVPADRYADIAGFLGWTVEQVMGVAPEPAKTQAPADATEPVYTKRANDIAKMFDELKDPKVRQAAYAGVQAILQMAKAGQRLPEPPAAPSPATPTQKSLVPAPAPKKSHRPAG